MSSAFISWFKSVVVGAAKIGDLCQKETVFSR